MKVEAEAIDTLPNLYTPVQSTFIAQLTVVESGKPADSQIGSEGGSALSAWSWLILARPIVRNEALPMQMTAFHMVE